jgi:S-adenosylmethionine/arginine decarboxylase-like enzyme
MVTKRFYATEENTHSAGAGLAGEPQDAINLTRLSTIKEQKKYPGPKSRRSKSRVNNPQIHTTNRQSPKYVKKESKKMRKNVFGYELIMDLSGCNPAIISSKHKLSEYVTELCRLIKMEKYGKTYLPYFGLEKPHTKGYSLLQFIETSSITGHFSEYWNKSYINIFSCKAYNHKLARKFTKEFFGATGIRSKFLIR